MWRKRLGQDIRSRGILLSSDAFRHVRGKTQHSFEDVGERRLKNIPDTIRAYKVDLAGGTAQPRPFQTLTGKHPDIPDKPSVAVLPFENKTADPSQDYFADGISEGVIAELGRFPNLFVVARNSTFAFRGTAFDLRDVSKELGARFIFEGSVRRSGNRVRVSAQLIDAIAGKHRWAVRCDRDLDDIFAVQDEITRNVAASVAPQIEVAEIEQVRSRHTQNVSAYDMALKATALYDDALVMGRPDFLEEAIATADRSLSIDPRSALALLVQAKALGFMFLFRLGGSAG